MAAVNIVENSINWKIGVIEDEFILLMDFFEYSDRITLDRAFDEVKKKHIWRNCVSHR